MSVRVRSCFLLPSQDRMTGWPCMCLSGLFYLVLLLWQFAASHAFAATKVHTVFVGAGKNVPYSVIGDPAGALPGEKQLRVRPLLVDDKVKEWTSGETHAITDRSF